MNTIDSIILYDKDNELFNYPFKLQYVNYVEEIDFYFYGNDYKDQEEMLKARIDYCSKELFNHYMEIFEYLQEICLDDSIQANNDSVNNINKLLETLWGLHIVFNKIHCNHNVTIRLNENIDELLEMFLLLEDYYTIEKKADLHLWKNKIIGLKKQ
jgi:hypothetical protein